MTDYQEVHFCADTQTSCNEIQISEEGEEKKKWSSEENFRVYLVLPWNAVKWRRAEYEYLCVRFQVSQINKKKEKKKNN